MAQANDVTALVRQTDPRSILKAAALCDGHSIIAPQAFRAVGLPQMVVDQLTIEHRSDTSDPKSTIFHEGRVLDTVRGVYGLQMLQFIAGALGVPYRSCMGRGFQARAIREALHEHFKGQW